ncbi:MAG: hypothetical protein Q7S40_10730 [Opitutaceae bacterium]|nr:hypothetical protein [Opitutaceae bacterium]
MNTTARLLTLLAVSVFAYGCQHIRIVRRSSPPRAATATPAATRTFSPSPRLIVGRVLAVDPARGFAFVDLGSDAPPAALAEGTELTSRTLDLRDTAQLRASRQLRGRTLGATVISGQPSPGDEVVWHAP